MGLGIMAEQPDFQTHGWSVLTHVVATPTPRGSKVREIRGVVNVCYVVCVGCSQLCPSLQLLWLSH